MWLCILCIVLLWGEKSGCEEVGDTAQHHILWYGKLGGFILLQYPPAIRFNLLKFFTTSVSFHEIKKHYFLKLTFQGCIRCSAPCLVDNDTVTFNTNGQCYHQRIGWLMTISLSKGEAATWCVLKELTMPTSLYFIVFVVCLSFWLIISMNLF